MSVSWASRSTRLIVVATSCASSAIKVGLVPPARTAPGQPTTSTPTGSSLRNTGSNSIDTGRPTASHKVRSKGAESSPSCHKNERREANACPVAVARSEVISTEPKSSPAMAVERSAPGWPAGSYRSAKLALLIDLAASHTSVRAWGLLESPRITAATRSSARSRSSASSAWKRTSATSHWVVKPMIALTARNSTLARYWLGGYAAPPTSTGGARKNTATPAVTTHNWGRSPCSAVQNTGSSATTAIPELAPPAELRRNATPVRKIRDGNTSRARPSDPCNGVSRTKPARTPNATATAN